MGQCLACPACVHAIPCHGFYQTRYTLRGARQHQAVGDANRQIWCCFAAVTRGDTRHGMSKPQWRILFLQQAHKAQGNNGVKNSAEAKGGFIIGPLSLIILPFGTYESCTERFSFSPVPRLAVENRWRLRPGAEDGRWGSGCRKAFSKAASFRQGSFGEVRRLPPYN